MNNTFLNERELVFLQRPPASAEHRTKASLWILVPPPHHPCSFYARVLPGVTLPELNLNHCGCGGNWAYLIHLLYLIKLLLVCCSELKLDPKLPLNKREQEGDRLLVLCPHMQSSKKKKTTPLVSQLAAKPLFKESANTGWNTAVSQAVMYLADGC